MEEAWHNRALCRGESTEMFFPDKGDSGWTAKAVCRRCPVKVECLNDALRRNERYGIWGGMSERERRRLKRMAEAG